MIFAVFQDYYDKNKKLHKPTHMVGSSYKNPMKKKILEFFQKFPNLGQNGFFIESNDLLSLSNRK